MAQANRDIKLIVYSSPLFPAHWALFIPTAANPDVSKIIHATRDVLQGFEVEFKRGYNEAATTRQKEVIDLCTVNGAHVDNGPLQRSTDKRPIDDIERKAAAIPAPGKSLRSAGSMDTTKVEIKNCQTWLREVVEALIEDKVFSPTALAALDEAPKN